METLLLLILITFSVKTYGLDTKASSKIWTSENVPTDRAKPILRYGFHRTQECQSYQRAYLCIRKCLDLNYDVASADKNCVCTCYSRNDKAKYKPNTFGKPTKWQLGAPTTSKPVWAQSQKKLSAPEVFSDFSNEHKIHHDFSGEDGALIHKAVTISKSDDVNGGTNDGTVSDIDHGAKVDTNDNATDSAHNVGMNVDDTGSPDNGTHGVHDVTNDDKSIDIKDGASNVTNEDTNDVTNTNIGSNNSVNASTNDSPNGGTNEGTSAGADVSANNNTKGGADGGTNDGANVDNNEKPNVNANSGTNDSPNSSTDKSTSDGADVGGDNFPKEGAGGSKNDGAKGDASGDANAANTDGTNVDTNNTAKNDTVANGDAIPENSDGLKQSNKGGGAEGSGESAFA